MQVVIILKSMLLSAYNIYFYSKVKVRSDYSLYAKLKNIKMAPTIFSWRHLAVCDLDRIQTCNLLSRNQMRYSVAPRGHCFLIV